MSGLAWSSTLSLNLGAADLWDLLWRPETQASWLGPGSDVELHAGRRCALRDEAGVWRIAVIKLVKRPERFELAGGTTIAITSEEDGCELTISDLVGGPEVVRYWTRRLELVKQLSGAVARRRRQVSQAVIVIHGIGEQHPGTTLRNLVASGALVDPVGEGVWVKARPPLGVLRAAQGDVQDRLRGPAPPH